MRRTRMLCVLLGALLLVSSGCATTGPKTKEDPFEGFNRGIFWFNEGLDRFIIGPVARGYNWLLPDFMQTGVRNFYANISMPIVLINDILQLKPLAAAEDVSRIFINSTVGIAGFVDVARMAEVPENDEDFGQTLGYWGLPPGPYVVIPLYGPSSIRGTVGLAADTVSLPHLYFLPWYANGIMGAVRILGWRAFYDEELEQSRRDAIDFYSFVRSSYQQNREMRVSDQEELGFEEQDDIYYFEYEEEAPGPPPVPENFEHREGVEVVPEFRDRSTRGGGGEEE